CLPKLDRTIECALRLLAVVVAHENRLHGQPLCCRGVRTTGDSPSSAAGPQVDRPAVRAMPSVYAGSAKEDSMEPASTYPLNLSVDYPDRNLNRLTTA